MYISGEQFGRKLNQAVNGNKLLFWKEVSKVNGGKGRDLQQNKGWKWEVITGRG